MIRVTVLAVIAGYADTIGYLHLDAFAGLMTGNAIFMGMELATSKYDIAAFHVVIIPALLFGVILGRLTIRIGAKVWLAPTHASLLLVVCSFVDKIWGASLLALGWGSRTRLPIDLLASL